MAPHDSAMYSTTWQILQHYRDSIIFEADEDLAESEPLPKQPTMRESGRRRSSGHARKPGSRGESRNPYALTPETLSPTSSTRSDSPEAGYSSSHTSTSSGFGADKPKEIRARRSPPGSRSNWPIDLKLLRTNGSTDLDSNGLSKLRYTKQQLRGEPSPTEAPPVPTKNARRSLIGAPPSLRPSITKNQPTNAIGQRRPSDFDEQYMVQPLKIGNNGRKAEEPSRVNSNGTGPLRNMSNQLPSNPRPNPAGASTYGSGPVIKPKQESYGSAFAQGLQNRPRNDSVDTYGDHLSPKSTGLSNLVAAGLRSASDYGESPKDSPSSAYTNKLSGRDDSRSPPAPNHGAQRSLTFANLAAPFIQPDPAAGYNPEYDGSALSPRDKGPRPSFGFQAPLQSNRYDLDSPRSQSDRYRRESLPVSPRSALPSSSRARKSSSMLSPRMFRVDPPEGSPRARRESSPLSPKSALPRQSGSWRGASVFSPQPPRTGTSDNGQYRRDTVPVSPKSAVPPPQGKRRSSRLSLLKPFRSGAFQEASEDRRNSSPVSPKSAVPPQLGGPVAPRRSVPKAHGHSQKASLSAIGKPSRKLSEMTTRVDSINALEQGRVSPLPPPPPPKPVGLPSGPKSLRKARADAPPLPPKDATMPPEAPQQQIGSMSFNARVDSLKAGTNSREQPPQEQGPAGGSFSLARSPAPEIDVSQGPYDSRQVMTSADISGDLDAPGKKDSEQVDPASANRYESLTYEPSPRSGGFGNPYALSPSMDFSGGGPGPTAPSSAVSAGFGGGMNSGRGNGNLAVPSASAFLSPAAAAAMPAPDRTSSKRTAQSPFSASGRWRNSDAESDYWSGNDSRFSQGSRANGMRSQSSPGLPPKAPSSGMAMSPFGGAGTRLSKSPSVSTLNMEASGTSRRHKRMGSTNLRASLDSPTATRLSFKSTHSAPDNADAAAADGRGRAPNTQAPSLPPAPRGLSVGGRAAGRIGLPSGGPRPGGSISKAAAAPQQPPVPPAGAFGPPGASQATMPVPGALNKSMTMPVGGAGPTSKAAPGGLTKARTLPPGAGFGLPGMPRNVRAGVPGRPAGTMRIGG